MVSIITPGLTLLRLDLHYYACTYITTHGLTLLRMDLHYYAWTIYYFRYWNSKQGRV